jgi:hypothetical protein
MPVVPVMMMVPVVVVAVMVASVRERWTQQGERRSEDYWQSNLSESLQHVTASLFPACWMDVRTRRLLREQAAHIKVG